MSDISSSVRTTDAIYCGAFTENAASLRVQEKAGFVRDGDTTLFSRPRGGDFPHVNTVLTRGDSNGPDHAGGMPGGA